MTQYIHDEPDRHYSRTDYLPDSDKDFSEAERPALAAALAALHEAAMQRRNVVRHKIKFVEVKYPGNRYRIRCLFPNYWPNWATKVLNEFFSVEPDEK